MTVVVPLGNIMKPANQLTIKKNAAKADKAIKKNENLIARREDRDGNSKI